MYSALKLYCQNIRLTFTPYNILNTQNTLTETLTSVITLLHYRSFLNHKNKYQFSYRTRDGTKIDLVVNLFMSKFTRALHHIRLFVFCFQRFLCSHTNHANKTNFSFAHFSCFIVAMYQRLIFIIFAMQTDKSNYYNESHKLKGMYNINHRGIFQE